MTSEILDMIEEKRFAKRNMQKCKMSNTLAYTSQNKRSKRYMTRQCRKAEKFCAKHDTFHFHNKLQDYIFKRTSISKIAKNNKILIDLQEIYGMREEYI